MNETSKPKPPLEPWQWPEEHWRRLVNQVRAGKTYRPRSWKGGARCAVRAVVRFRPRDQRAARRRQVDRAHGLGPVRQPRRRAAHPEAACKNTTVPATFYVPAVRALLHPDEQRRVIAEGHEIGIHGWIHELNSVLPYEAERDLMTRAADTLEKITGVRPVGARTPSWDFRPHTLRITREVGPALQFLADGRRRLLRTAARRRADRRVEFPVEWIRDDAVYFMMHRFQCAAALHAAEGRVRHVQARVRGGL